MFFFPRQQIRFEPGRIKYILHHHYYDNAVKRNNGRDNSDDESKIIIVRRRVERLFRVRQCRYCNVFVQSN